ncbi:MAG TPA: carboxypeptidase-like regulatory domain-containing protein [Bryobacteraceae bacterium]|jgi:hypothetical protein|nr:carboxypeptidase-like regulatory domain-containing protein [Bryobacteraceae bacterium]
MKIKAAAAGFLIGILFCTLPLLAQSTAQISGTVKDESGAGVPGAEVKLTHTSTGAVRTVSTESNGSYVLTNLPLGSYTLEASKSGFSKAVESGIVLQVDSNPTVDVALKVGAVNEQISVEANALQVETHSTGVGQVVDNVRVVEMPLNGRNPLELVLLAGMASLPGPGAINNVRNYPTIVISVAGGQGGNSAMYLLDGAIHEDPYNNLTLPLPFPDAMQEFKVETSALGAQYGYHSGSVVNVVTKSGTNDFHGDLFEFVRNGDFNARDFFATKRDTLKRNQFGGVAGGHIIRDKLFFFGGYQRTTQRSDPNALTAFVPTANMVAGDFTAVTSPACENGTQINLSPSLGFAGNKIATSLLSPVALNIVKTMPVSPDPCGRTIYGYNAGLDEDLIVGRIDYQKSEKHSIFGRYNAGHLLNSSTYDGHNPLSINNYGVHDLNYAIALGDTYLISPNLVNSFRVAASRTNVVKIPDAYKSLADFGANYTPIGGHIVDLTVAGVGGGFAIGSTASVPGEAHTGPNASITDDVNWVKGSHQFGFGGNVYKRIMNYWSGVNAVGSASFNGTVTGLAMADFLLGDAVSFSQGTNYGMYLYQYYASVYAQDSWKITSRLTVNYGLRWEPYLSNINKYGQLDHFDPALYTAGFRSRVFTNAPVGLAFAGDPQYKCANGYNCSDYNKFFPRVGLVIDPEGNGRMTIRASYGMFGDRLHQFFPNQMGFGPPFGNNVGLANVNIADPWANYPGGNAIPYLVNCSPVGHARTDCTFPTAGAYVTFNTSDYKPMYTHQWNLSIQRQVGDWLLSANYIGNSSIHLGTSEELNPAAFMGLGSCTLSVVKGGVVVPTTFPTCSTTANQNQRRVFYLQNPVAGQYYAGIGAYDPGGTGNYNGLYLSANKRLSHNVTLNTNYTWSHCISDIYDQQTGSGGLSPAIRREGRGNCVGADLRHNFVLNLVAQSPRFTNNWERWLASDWQLAPILVLRSGSYFTVVPGTDRALTTEPSQTANLVSPSGVFSPNRTVNNWLNSAAFAIPALGTYGNLGQNNIEGPGMIQFNVALSRSFHVWGEGRTLQVRADAFNLVNHLNPSNPVSNRSSSTFGQILSDISGNNGLDAGDPRIIQLAMKFVF